MESELDMDDIEPMGPMKLDVVVPSAQDMLPVLLEQAFTVAHHLLNSKPSSNAERAARGLLELISTHFADDLDEDADEVCSSCGSSLITGPHASPYHLRYCMEADERHAWAEQYGPVPEFR